MSGGGRFDPTQYEGVDERIAKFRKDFPGAKGRIETIDLKTEKACIWRAEVYVWQDNHGMTLIATGHALDKWGQSSQYEKTEKAAIGRALVMAGYSSKPGASREEMELHNDRENTPQTSPQPSRSVGKPARVSQEQFPNSSPSTDSAATPDRSKFRPSYVAAIKGAENMVEQGKTKDEIKAFFVSKKRAMKPEEYEDAQGQLARLWKMCDDRDAALVAEADAEIDAAAEDEF